MSYRTTASKYRTPIERENRKHEIRDFLEGQYTKERQDAKARQRQQKSLLVMKKYGDKYPCSECLHRKSGACTDDLPNGCEYWFSPNSEKTGIAYHKAGKQDEKLFAKL